LLADILPRLFVLAFVVPHCSSNDEELEAADLARKLWNGWKNSSYKDPVSMVTQEVRRLLSDFLTDTAVRPRYVTLTVVIHYAELALDLSQYYTPLLMLVWTYSHWL
jgi:hypothetical protein